jgi:uncharacterized protein (TIGR03437 family)
MQMRRSRFDFPIRSPRTPGLWMRSALLVLATAAGAGAQGQNQIVGVGFPTLEYQSELNLPMVAPGGVLTLYTPPLGVADSVAKEIPLPNSLSGVSVAVRVLGATDSTGYPTSLPILRVESVNLAQLPAGADCANVTGPTPVLCSYSRISVQIPTERVCAPSPLFGLPYPRPCPAPPFFEEFPPMLVLNVKANGVTGPDMPVQVFEGWAHLLNACEPFLDPPAIRVTGDLGICRYPLVTHADGTLITDDSPARVGETITFYGVGFGVAFSERNVGTGRAPSVPIPRGPGGRVTFRYLASGPPPSGVQAGALGTSTFMQTVVPTDWIGMIPDFVGLYQVNVTVPPLPDKVYPCGRTYTGHPGNAQILDFDTDTPLYICVQP